MSFYEIDQKVNQVAHAWEELKAINERCLLEEKNKGEADALSINLKCTHSLDQ